MRIFLIDPHSCSTFNFGFNPIFIDINFISSKMSFRICETNNIVISAYDKRIIYVLPLFLFQSIFFSFLSVKIRLFIIRFEGRAFHFLWDLIFFYLSNIIIDHE